MVEVVRGRSVWTRTSRGRRATARASPRCRYPGRHRRPRVESIVDWTLGWTPPLGMIPAPWERAIAPPKARLPTFGDELVQGGRGILDRLLLFRSRRLLVFVDALPVVLAHLPAYARVRLSDARAWADLYYPSRTLRCSTTRSAGRRFSRPSAPGCTSGRRRATPASRPFRGASWRSAPGSARPGGVRARRDDPPDRRHQGP